MDWLAFVASLVGALAWPATVLALAVLFRGQLERLIVSLRHLRYGKFGADFGEQLEAVKQEAQAVLTELPTAPEVAAPEASERPFARLIRRGDRIERLAEDAPRAVVIESWLDVEDAIRASATRAGVEATLTMPLTRILDELSRRELVDRRLLRLVNGLRKLRDEAAHVREFEITRTEAIKYAAVARLIVDALAEVAPPRSPAFKDG